MASAGDQNHDGYDDVLVGAHGDDGAGGRRAYVFSGRTYKLLRRFDGAPGRRLRLAADRPGPRRHRPDRRRARPSPAAAARTCSRGARELFSLAPPPARARSASSSSPASAASTATASPDFYAADYAAQNGNGYAAVYSGRDGSVIHALAGGPGDGTGPGPRGRRRQPRRAHRPRRRLLHAPATARRRRARRRLLRAARGSVLRTITSTTAGENLGFDAVGVGDVNRDGRPDLLLSAAEGDTVYLVAG